MYDCVHNPSTVYIIVFQEKYCYIYVLFISISIFYFALLYSAFNE